MSDAVLLAGVFLGASVSSLVGFAFSPVAGLLLFTIWPPATVVPLLMACSIVVQLVSLVRLRGTVAVAPVGPMLLGGVAGVPVAVAILHRIDTDMFTFAFACLLAVYALFMLRKPMARPTMPAGSGMRAFVGFAGGLVGGLTAMPATIPVMFSEWRGESKEVQRATILPFILAMQMLSLVALALSDGLNGEIISLLMRALPGLAAGCGVGLALFGRLNSGCFRRLVLWILFATSVMSLLKLGFGH